MRMSVSLRLPPPSERIPITALSHILTNSRQRVARVIFRPEEMAHRVEQLKEAARRKDRGGRQLRNLRR